MKFWLNINGTQSGPHTLEEVSAMTFNPENTYAWHNGLSDWQKISDVSELADAAKAAGMRYAAQFAPINTEEAPQPDEETPEATEEAPQATEEAPQATEEAPQATEETPEAAEEAPQPTEEAPQTADAPTDDTEIAIGIPVYGQPYGAPQQPYSAPQQPYGAPQQPYSAPQQPYSAPQGEPYKPSAWIMVLAIICTLFCCQITGILAIVYAAIASSASAQGNYINARKKAETAELWIMVSFAIGLVITPFYLALSLLM